MVRIRLSRHGRHNRPFYRINAVDKRVRRNGSVIENLGWYDPCAPDESKQLHLDEERVKYWIGVGAQPSETVMDFLAKRNLVKTERWEARRKHRREVVAARAAAAPAADKKDDAAPAAKADEPKTA